MFILLCVFVCVREREKEKDRETVVIVTEEGISQIVAFPSELKRTPDLLLSL